MRCAEPELAARIEGAKHVDRQIDLVEVALVGLGAGVRLCRGRQVAIDVDVVDGQIEAQGLALETERARELGIVERERHVAHAELSGIVDEVGARAGSPEYVFVCGLDLEVEYFEYVAGIERKDLDGAGEPQVAEQVAARQAAGHVYA